MTQNDKCSIDTVDNAQFRSRVIC
uniref:Uncharacterized protein n=1 Tax=Arundo donax TaxID=35708 RepID=A0A0A9BN20_ARUDO